jgi:hypothetical protein
MMERVITKNASRAVYLVAALGGVGVALQGGHWALRLFGILWAVCFGIWFWRDR